MLDWFVGSVRTHLAQLRSFMPVLLRKNTSVDVFLRTCDTIGAIIEKLSNKTKKDTLAQFRLCGYIEQINNLLVFAGKLLKRSIKTTSAIVSSIDVADNISNIGRYTGNISQFVNSPMQDTMMQELTKDIVCGDVGKLYKLYSKYTSTSAWLVLLQRCNRPDLLEQSKNNILKVADLPVVMAATWLEQMPQLFLIAASPYTDMNIPAICATHKLNAHVITVSNFKLDDIEYILPRAPMSSTVGITAAYVERTRTIRHIESGGAIGGITHARHTGRTAIIETNGKLSRFIESPSNITRGTPSERIHDYNTILENGILRKLRQHVCMDVTKVDYNNMIDGVINLLQSYYNADDVETRLCAMVPNMNTPEIRLTVLRSISPIIDEIRSSPTKLSAERIRDLVICKTGIVENILRKAYIMS